MKYNTDDLIWRYWAANEMARLICAEHNPELIDENMYIYAEGTKIAHRNWLTKILKKEWFR